MQTALDFYHLITVRGDDAYVEVIERERDIEVKIEMGTDKQSYATTFNMIRLKDREGKGTGSGG